MVLVMLARRRPTRRVCTFLAAASAKAIPGREASVCISCAAASGITQIVLNRIFMKVMHGRWVVGQHLDPIGSVDGNTCTLNDHVRCFA